MKMRKACLVAAVAVLAVSGCSSAKPGVPTSTPSAEKINGVRISVPPRVTAGKTAQMVVESGYTGKAKVYVFAIPTGGAPDCTDASVQGDEVDISEGRQSVPLYSEVVGDATVVVAGEGFATKCGEIKTRVVDLPVLSAKHPMDDPASVRSGQALTVLVGSRAPAPSQLKAHTVKVDLVGPWASAPEAEQGKCEDAPVVASQTVQLTEMIQPSGSRGWVPVRMTAPKPGIYRVLTSSQQTDWTEASRMECSSGPLYVVKA